MRAIVTKYFGPGNSRGSRIKAEADGVKAIVVPYDHALDALENHVVAATKLARQNGWKGTLHAGFLPGSGYAFVFGGNGVRV